MTSMFRQLASTAIAVMMASGFPLAQESPRLPAQVTPPASAAGQPVPAPESRVVDQPADAEATRERLRVLLERHPPSLAQVFRIDPTLLVNADYLAPYPELAAFLAAHPEVARNPAYFVGTMYESAWERDPHQAALRMWENVLQGVFILSMFLVVTGVLVWLVRTVVDYRRWLRLTRIQTETHTKLLDRLTSQEDLLGYMQTPAGRRFLESAPIALDAASRPLGAPLSRVLWSVQAGLVLALGGLGMLVVSARAIPEVAQGLWAIGIVALAIGGGFVLSAVVAYVLSRRMGLFDQAPAAPADPLAASALSRGRD